MGVWVALAGAVISGIGAAKAKKGDRAAATAMTDLESRNAMRLSSFQAKQDYYYKQMDKKEAERGLDQFKQFSNLQTIAPDYVNTDPGIVVPDMPMPPVEPEKYKKKKKDMPFGTSGYALQRAGVL